MKRKYSLGRKNAEDWHAGGGVQEELDQWFRRTACPWVLDRAFFGSCFDHNKYPPDNPNLIPAPLLPGEGGAHYQSVLHAQLSSPPALHES